MCIGSFEYRAEVRTLEVWMIDYDEWDRDNPYYDYYFGTEDQAREYAKKHTSGGADNIGIDGCYGTTCNITKQVVNVLIPIKDVSGDMDWDNAVVFDKYEKLISRD